MQALVRAFPSGEDHPELALVRAGGDLVQGHLDEAAAHLAVAEAYVATAPPDRQRRLQVAIASLRLSLSRRRGHLAGVIEQVRFLASPVTGQSDEDIALGSDLRAVALMNLGTVEAWTLALPDAERHLRQGAALAREIGRPYLEVGCLSRARLRVEDRAVRHHPAALPGGDSAGRTARLGRGTGDLARAVDDGGHGGVAGGIRRGRAMAAAHRPGPANRHRSDHAAWCCTTRPRCCTRAAAASRRRSRSSARPSDCARSSRGRTRWRAR